jgi:hypothetical protein
MSFGSPLDCCLSLSYYYHTCRHFSSSTLQIVHLLPLNTVSNFYSSTPVMSFLGGAECSTAGNPISQFTKHVQDDKSLQRDRLVGRGPGGVQESMRSQAMGPGQDGVCCPPRIQL